MKRFARLFFPLPVFCVLLIAVQPASAAPSSACPADKALRNFQSAPTVDAIFSTSSNVTTYRFLSLANENPVGGVPGLIKYCVYPSSGAPTTIDAQATGASGEAWTGRNGRRSFSFGRPFGNPSNIPLNGLTTVIGTATWTTVPENQTILLHINDPSVCTAVYGLNSEDTCFVKPGMATVCDHGETDVAYNAMPFGVVNCPTPSEAFEATSTSEFGDEVELGGTARELVSLKVLFASYACTSGHWDTNTCVTTPAGATFTHPITANIYSVKDCGGTPCPDSLLATVESIATIPYRPSADASSCTGGDVGKWFNAFAGQCETHISTVLTFSFSPGITLPNTIIWTVAFDTTHYGSPPIGEGAPCFSTSGGCPYDSLNVGTMTYTGASYAGTDVDPHGAFLNSTWPGAYCDGGLGGTGILRLDTSATNCWDGFTPLAEVITK
jgi:hypothetical protein